MDGEPEGYVLDLGCFVMGEPRPESVSREAKNLGLPVIMADDRVSDGEHDTLTYHDKKVFDSRNHSVDYPSGVHCREG